MLAYLHRFVFPILIFAVPLCFSDERSNLLLGIGIGCIVYALYSLLGYVLRWKHIYCSYQNAYHEEMTPHNVNWGKIKKSDAYGIPLIFGVLGIACVCVF